MTLDASDGLPIADGFSEVRPLEEIPLTASTHDRQVSKAPTAQSNSPLSLFTQTHQAKQKAVP